MVATYVLYARTEKEDISDVIVAINLLFCKSVKFLYERNDSPTKVKIFKDLPVFLKFTGLVNRI